MRTPTLADFIPSTLQQRKPEEPVKAGQPDKPENLQKLQKLQKLQEKCKKVQKLHKELHGVIQWHAVLAIVSQRFAGVRMLRFFACVVEPHSQTRQFHVHGDQITGKSRDRGGRDVGRINPASGPRDSVNEAETRVSTQLVYENRVSLRRQREAALRRLPRLAFHVEEDDFSR